MNIGMLSLTQAPPLWVPLRFMLTAPLFGMVAALVMVFEGDALLASRWSIPSLMGVHAMALGFILMVMMGAMQQLLPVLVGLTIPKADQVGLLIYLLMVSGTAVLLMGFWYQQPILLMVAVGLLLVASSGFVLSVGYALVRTPSAHPTTQAMMVSLLSLLVTLVTITLLLMGADWQVPMAHPMTDLHLSWGLVGTMGLLLVGVAYQVVPMFQITPEYPQWLQRYLGKGVVTGLLLFSLVTLMMPESLWASRLAVGWLSLNLGGFALMTLQLQSRRRRRLPDVTLNFWRLAMFSLLGAILVWWIGRLGLFGRANELAFVLFLFGFITAAISGMLYKIVPFLVWLHLNNRMNELSHWQGDIPTMRQVIPERYGRWLIRLHLLALATLMVALLGVEAMMPLSGGIWLGYFATLFWTLLVGLRCYRRVLGQLVVAT